MARYVAPVSSLELNASAHQSTADHSNSQHKDKKVPRGAAERADYTGVAEELNNNRATMGHHSDYEPRSYFDWASDDEEGK